MRMTTLLLIFILFLVFSNFVSAEPLTLQANADRIGLTVVVPPKTDYRVWYSLNPMKVIIDLEHFYPELVGRHDFDDVALRTMRIDQGPGDIGTRMVLEFNYVLPTPKWRYENDLLTIQIDTVFVQSTVRTITPGVRYGHERRGIAAGPLIVNFLEVDLTHPNLEIRSVLAQDQVYGREHVSDMAKRSNAIAAVNGLFFAPDGRPLGLMVIDGRLITEPFANRTAIGFKPGNAVIGAVGFSGSITNITKDKSIKISGINRPRLTDEVIIYTSDHGSTTKTNSFGVDLIVIDQKVVEICEGNAVIPENGIVISGHGVARDFFLEHFAVGDLVEWSMTLEPDWLAEGYVNLIGGGPRLVENGQIKITGEIERFQPDVLYSRAPRTALGITKDKKLLLVTVNGRQPGISVGVTLTELAEIMIDLGAVDAMNLDGGGSTTMVIRNQVLNLPSDGIERPVSNGIMIINPESRK